MIATDRQNTDVQITHLKSNCFMMFQMTHSTRSLKKKQWISIVALLILKLILIFIAKYVGTITLPQKIRF